MEVLALARSVAVWKSAWSVAPSVWARSAEVAETSDRSMTPLFEGSESAFSIASDDDEEEEAKRAAEEEKARLWLLLKGRKSNRFCFESRRLLCRRAAVVARWVLWFQVLCC